MTMKTTHTLKVLAAAFVGALALGASTTTFAQSSRFDELANVPFPENLPTKEATQTLRDELLFQRALPILVLRAPSFMPERARSSSSAKDGGAASAENPPKVRHKNVRKNFDPNWNTKILQ
jgi:hypothetical protein